MLARVTLEEINKEVQWKEKGRNENSQTIQPWEGERWVTDAKRGGPLFNIYEFLG